MPDLYEAQYRRDHGSILSAAWRGDVAALRDRLTRQPADSVGTARGERSIHLAALRGHLPAVKVLVEHGADIFQTDDYGLTCLHLAARSGNVATVEYFVQAGIPVDVGDGLGRTPAFSAAAAGHEQLIRRLAEKGADVTTASCDGMSPIHLAARAGRSMARVLIEAFGANPSAPNGSGQTPLHCATLSGNEDLALWLYAEWPGVAADVDETGDTLLHAAVQGRNHALIRKLIDDGADVNARHDVQATPLMAARSSRDALMLIRAGADVHARDDLGRTALHTAYTRRRLGVMRVLLHTGADAGAMTKAGESVITLAAKWGDGRLRRFIEHELDVTLHPRLPPAAYG